MYLNRPVRRTPLSSFVFRLSSFGIAAALTSSVHAAAPVIFTDTSNLLPNTPNQTVRVFVLGTDVIQGEDLNFQINTGASGPTFSSIDIIAGTIFAPSNTGPGGMGIISSGTISSHLAIYSTTTNPSLAPTVPDNAAGLPALLATLVVSTGPSSGSQFTLSMTNTLNGPSDFILSAISSINLSQPHNLFSVATAPDRQWLINGGGQWDSNPNWTPFAPYAQGDNANFLGALTAGTANVTLDGVRTVGTVNFNNAAGTYNLQPGAGGSIDLNNGASAPSINSSAGSHIIAAPISFATNTNLNIGNSTLTISGVLTGGSSSISLNGNGRLILSGNNTYGATNIAAGSTLQVGSGGTSGSLGNGAVSNSGSLIFSRTDAASVGSAISGIGSLSQAGSGTTTISGVANYTGPTSIAAGQLIFGGGVSHSIKGVTGAGTLQVAASSTLTSDGINMLTGTLAVNGTLVIRSNPGNGAYPNSSPATVRPGTSKVAALTFASPTAGQIDIKNNALLVEATAGTKLAAKQALASAINSVTFKNIVSSSAATNTAYTVVLADNADLGVGSTSFGGLPVGTNSLIVTQALIGDANLDGFVDLTDFTIWQKNAGKSNSYSVAQGDLNDDGFVDLTDFTLWQKRAGNSVATKGNPADTGVVPIGPSGSSPVPEPSSLALLGLSSLFLLKRKRSRC